MHPSSQASLSLSGLALCEGSAWGHEPRAVLEWACGLGYRVVQLDVTMPGLRPRDLDQSARRDLRGTLARRGVAISGLDVFIPPTHFVLGEFVDRAAGAVRDALDLSAGWGTVPVSVVLPAGTGEEVVASLVSHAERVGVGLADCAWPTRVRTTGAPGLCVSIDPAAVILAAADVGGAVAGAGGRVVSARLSDAVGGVRAEAGAPGGVLDVDAYRIALSLAGYAGPLVCDLRGLRDHVGAAARLRRTVEGQSA